MYCLPEKRYEYLVERQFEFALSFCRKDHSTGEKRFLYVGAKASVLDSAEAPA
jgi:hypothetical protein